MKKLGIGLAGVLVLVLAGAWFFVNEIVGSAIEQAGSYAMGVDTRVGFVRLRIVPGDFRLNRLRIANPAGFEESHFLKLGRATIDVDVGTLLEPVVVISELRVDAVDVALERADKKTNYGVILASVTRFEQQDSEGAVPAEDQGSSTRFIVRRILVTNVDAYVEWNELAADQTGLKLHIPEIELKEVGAKNGKGVSMAELSNIVLKAILGSIARYGGDLPGVMLSALKGGMSGVVRVPGVEVTGLGGSAVEKMGKAVGGEVGDAIQGVGGDAAKSVGEAVGDSAKKAMGGIFGDKDEK